MAVTSLWAIKGRIDHLIRYVENPEKTSLNPEDKAMQELNHVLNYTTDAKKTEQKLFVSGINCLPEIAVQERQLYVGCRQFTGRSKLKLVTYRCAKKNNYGDAHCVNKSVNLLYIENFVFKEVAKIVFDPARIPQLIQTYYDSCGELIGDSESKLKLLRTNLKAAQQKLDNIVSVITQTGSPALLSTLEKLEGEKAALEIQIGDEESRLISNTLNEKEIIAAFKHAKDMFLNGTLPQRKQLLNLYINRIDVYPEHIEIMLNNIPSNHLNPARENALLSAENGGQDALHIFKMRKDPPADVTQRTGLNVVEANSNNY